MAMKICKDCGNEISKGVKACPKCGKDQRNFFGKHKILTFIVAVILICVIATSNGENTNNDSSKTTLTSGNIVESNSTEENNTTNVKEEYNVGEIYEDDYIAIKYVSLNDNFTGYSQYADIKSGYKVIKAEFEFENLSSTDQYVSSFEFDCYADGYDCEDFYSVDDSGFSATLSAGKKTKGSVYFQVPKDAAEIDIEYTLDVWTSGKVIFVAK